MSKERLEFEPRYTISNEMAVASFFEVSAGKLSQETVLA